MLDYFHCLAIINNVGMNKNDYTYRLLFNICLEVKFLGHKAHI